MRNRFVAILLLLLFVVGIGNAQTSLTREQILAMSIEELSDLPLEDLMMAVETLGVTSVDELFAMIMNKNVSSASKVEEDAFTSPLSSSVLTKGEMRTYGVTTIEEAFRLIPGVIVQEKTNGMYDVQLRGLNNIPDNNLLLYAENANTLLMIDGRVAHNYAMGAVNFDMLSISIEDIERIEVVRGASSALYGGNAVQGVINIITEKTTPSSKAVSGSIQVGNQNSYIADIALRKSVNDVLSLGLTFNTQKRERATDKMYVMPQQGTFFADRTANLPAINEAMSPEQLGALMQTGALRDASKGGFYSISEIENLMQLIGTANTQDPTKLEYYLFETNMPQRALKGKYPDPKLARHTTGFNGYITITPNKDVRIDLTGGYQNSKAMATQVGDSYISFEGRTSKTCYGNLRASIYGLSLNADIMTGSNNYAVGVPGFKVKPLTYDLSAEYDINIGDVLSVRPGVTYQYIKYEDYTPTFDFGSGVGVGTQHKEGVQELCGFFDKEADINTFAPSIRFDAHLGDLRLIAALRSDRTSIPEDWNTSYQFVANYKFNENNFIRLNYGRANRSMTMVNTSSALEVERTNMVWPNTTHFVGNDDYDMMNMDNLEFGYRWRPSNALLIDAEAFLSWSRNYGALKSKSTYFTLTKDVMSQIINVGAVTLQQVVASIDRSAFGEGPEGEAAYTQALMGACGGAFGQLMASLNPHSLFEKEVDIQFGNLPYKVKQMGVSLGIDWIVSPKLITKFNLNVQKTTIDDYYAYDQTAAISEQLQQAGQMTSAGLVDVMTGYITYMLMSSDMNSATERYISDTFVNPNADDYIAASYGKMSAEQQQATLQAMYQAAVMGVGAYQDANGYVIEKPMAMYFGLKHNIRMDDNGNATLGNNQYTQPPLENGHKHKATPSFYGMVGLVYKPINKLNISAFANFMSEREYLTSFGTDKLCPRFTVNAKVGYNPISNIEVFVNAHNLFNNKKREFLYGDVIEGLYTFGVNFGF
ncbi:MAG: TonB-dependent receptor [Bacteroidia bacterium]|nr:TonB-dependent receptor [Bacteroidia bacterium]